MGAALSFLGEKLFASSTLINARCENISCCTSVAAVQPPIVRRTDSDFEVDLGESLHLQSDARLSIRSESRTAFCQLIAAATCTGWTPRSAR